MEVVCSACSRTGDYDPLLRKCPPGWIFTAISYDRRIATVSLCPKHAPEESLPPPDYKGEPKEIAAKLKSYGFAWELSPGLPLSAEIKGEGFHAKVWQADTQVFWTSTSLIEDGSGSAGVLGPDTFYGATFGFGMAIAGARVLAFLERRMNDAAKRLGDEE